MQNKIDKKEKILKGVGKKMRRVLVGVVACMMAIVILQCGDSGYSKVEGTVGNFPVHLHFGIYIMVDGNEITVNPYEILKKNENCILRYDF